MKIEHYKNCLSNGKFERTSESCKRRYKEKGIIEDDPDIFFNDYCRILGSTALRRLTGKAQVFFAPANPHVRTRRIHTDEVVAFGSRAAKILGLDDTLVMASAIGHDLGHTPFGHLGERVITKLIGHEFNHAVFSVWIAQNLGRLGLGYNLSKATLRGILNHNSKADFSKLPQEYKLVYYSDRISYTLGDYKDVLRYGLYKESEMPSMKLLGEDRWQWIENILYALAKESAGAGKLSFENSNEARLIRDLREWLLKNVYVSMDLAPHEHLLETVFNFLRNSKLFDKYDPVVLFSLMTDSEVIEIYNLLLVKPAEKISLEDLKHNGAVEVMEMLKPGMIDYTDPDLDW